MKFHNWNKTITSYPSKVFYPTNREEIAQIINRAINLGKKVKAVGKSRHVFSGISSVDDNQWIICMEKMNKFINIDTYNNTVTVEAGCTLQDLNDHLLRHDYCLNIMGGIDKQCIGGLIATSTHGSSLKYGSFSDAITNIELIDGQGFIKKYNSTHEHFGAVATNLGALGVVLNATLRITNAYNLKQTIEDLPSLPTHEEMLDILEKNDYCEILYFANTDEMVIRKRNRDKYEPRSAVFDKLKDDISNSFQELLIKIMNRHPSTIKRSFGFAKRTIIGSREGPAPQIFIANDIHGSYNITTVTDQEYSFPIEKMNDAYSALKEVFKKYPNVPIVGSIRFGPQSDKWMAMNNGNQRVYIDVSILTNRPPKELLEDLDKSAFELKARPHWGKRNNISSAYANEIYPKFDEFKRLAKDLDPDKLFINPYLSAVFDA